MATMQNLVDLARAPLNDDDKVTWSDAELLGYANTALKVLLAKRPDLFLGQFSAPPVEKALVDTFPLDDRVYPVVADYVTGKAQFKDAEEAVRTAAQSFFTLAEGGMT